MPSANLPTLDELARLPRWARVAFASRCARRSVCLFKEAWPEAPQQHLQRLREVAATVEQMARTSTCERNSDWHAMVAAAAAMFTSRRAVAAAQACAHAARAGWCGCLPEDALRAAELCLEAGGRDPALRQAIAADAARLRALADQKRWLDESPVDPDCLGPVCPEAPGAKHPQCT